MGFRFVSPGMNHATYLAYQFGAAVLAPWQRAALTSLRAASAASVSLPANLDHAFAAVELLAGLQVSGRRPPFGLSEDGLQEEVVCELPFCSLLRFRRGAGGPPVLLVAPLSGHFASRLRETVRGLLDGHDVYVTDWHNARDLPVSQGRFDLDDYVGYLLHFLRGIGARAHLVAICQGCIAALAATALLAEDEERARPLSLTLMCGPVDPRINPTAIGLFAANTPLPWFERCMTSVVPAGFQGAGRRVAPGFLNAPSLSRTESAGRMVALLQNCAGLGDRRQIEQVRQCLLDEYSLLDLSAEFYLSTIRQVFQEATLPRGQLRWRGRPVRPAAIRDCSLMTIEAAEDDVCGPGQTHAAQDLCSGLAPVLRRRLTQPRAGHVALFSGEAWTSQVCPALRRMMAERESDEAGTAADSRPRAPSVLRVPQPVST